MSDALPVGPDELPDQARLSQLFYQRPA